jgi:hypothetical protein
VGGARRFPAGPVFCGSNRNASNASPGEKGKRATGGGENGGVAQQKLYLLGVVRRRYTGADRRWNQDNLAEWSKALASGASPQGRGFETPQLSLIGQSWQHGAKAICGATKSPIRAPAALVIDLRASHLAGRDSPPRGRSCGPALRLESNVRGAGQGELNRRWGRMTPMKVIIMIVASMAAVTIIGVPIIISSANTTAIILDPPMIVVTMMTTIIGARGNEGGAAQGARPRGRGPEPRNCHSRIDPGPLRIPPEPPACQSPANRNARTRAARTFTNCRERRAPGAWGLVRCDIMVVMWPSRR